MTPEQVALVEATHARALPVLTEVARGAHDRLIAADPSLAQAFPSDRRELAGQLAAELSALVAALPDMAVFRPRTEALGARHRGYGVEASHYRLFAEALAGSLAERLGPAWTPEVADAWRLALSLISQSMLAGAAHPGTGGGGVSPAPPPGA